MQNMPPELQKVLKKSRVKQYPKDQIMVYEGDNIIEVGVIKSGAVKLYDIDTKGNEQILHIVTAPTVIPLAFFSGKESITKWSYATLTDCEVYILDQAELRKLMHGHKEVSEFLINNFSRDVHELLVRLNSLGKTVAQDKIVAALRFLLAHHSKNIRGNWWQVQFPVNHQLLADLAGITRESTAAIMKGLQDQKIVRNQKLSILEIHQERLSNA